MALWPIETAVVRHTAWLDHTGITSTLLLVDDRAYVILTFTGVPTNGQTIVVDGTTYTFKTTLAGANDVKIGASAAACASNLYDAIVDNATNEGTTYGSGTTAHPTCEAVYVSGESKVKIRYKTALPAGTNVYVSESLTNATLDSTFLRPIMAAPVSFVGAGLVELRACGGFGSSEGGDAPSLTRNYAY